MKQSLSLLFRGMTRFLSLIKEDVATVRERDPAASSKLEVLLLYPGLHAIWYYRVAHALQNRGMVFLARAISQIGRASCRERV